MVAHSVRSAKNSLVSVRVGGLMAPQGTVLAVNGAGRGGITLNHNVLNQIIILASTTKAIVNT